MSDMPFSRSYADVYDAIYSDKAYAAECDLIENVLGRHVPSKVRAILDLGCGTGGHAIRLASRGYDVTGVDRSAEMLRHAASKAVSTGVAVRLIEGDLRTVEIGELFDVVLLMFAVMSYQTTNDEVLAALRSAHRHLRPGGVVIFDVWYGPGVLTDTPGNRTKLLTTAAGTISRAASAELDSRRHLCRVHYELSAESGDRAVETHDMRYFFPLELELFLELAELRLISLSPFGSLDEKPSTGTWNVLVVAQAQ